MEIKKHEKLIFNGIEILFQEWSTKEQILEKELYRFLSMLKETGEAVSFHEISEIAKEKLEALNEHSHKKWNQSDWQEYLLDLIYFMHNYKRLEMNDTQVEKNQIKNLSLLLIMM